MTGPDDLPRRGSWGFQPADEVWEQRLIAVAEFLAEHEGRWPRSTRPAEADERRLGQWLGTQRREMRSLGLSEIRRRRLDETLPGWHERRAREHSGH
ncbi:helicase associated domain-containing protein [Nakamurella alba]|nr:helicase associated domain-containing protein [Nakamurella alba]